KSSFVRLRSVQVRPAVCWSCGMAEQEVEIRTLDGRSTKVQVKGDETVGSLKRLLHQQSLLCAPTLPFHLFLRGIKLGVSKSIESLSMQGGDFMVLMPYSREKQSAANLCQSGSSIGGCESFSSGGEVSSEGLSSNDSRTLEEPYGVCDLPVSKEAEKGSHHTVLNVEDSVWNEIAADLCEWKASVSLDGLDPGFDGQFEAREFSTSDVGHLGRPMEVRLKKRPSIEKVCSNLNSHVTTDTDINPEESSIAGSMKKKRPMRKMWSCPAVLARYYEIFKALNLIYGFLQKQHMQGTWQNMKTAVQQLCGVSGENLKIEDIETLAVLFPKLVQISFRAGEGEAESFNIDLLDPTKLPHDAVPRSLHQVMPLTLQKGIGPADLLPRPGVKQITDTVIKNSMQRRLSAFKTALTTLIEEFQDEYLKQKQKGEVMDYTVKEILHFVARSASNLEPNSKQTMPLPRPPRHHKKLARCMDTFDYSAEEMVDHLREGLGSLGQIVHCEVIEKREARYGELATALSYSTAAALKKLDITRFYKHQAEAINAALSRQSVIIATSTASGKSVCYNVPVLEELSSNTDSCALYLFPTKALAQDQYRALLEMTSGSNIPVCLGVYDGDTPQHQRVHLRDHARLLITNPDMLHVSILPSHKQFERLLSNLSYVVVDEAHAYRGAFGCHTSVILRRLRRLCHHLYRTNPTFIVSSATVANPREHAMELIGLREIQVVQEDGSPCGRKYFVLWDPPMYYTSKISKNGQSDCLDRNKVDSKLKDKKQLVCKKASPIVEISSLLSEMVQHNLRCISFCKTRKLCELVLSYTREILKETAPNLVESIRAYRAGYTAQDRRDIESELFGGKLRAVAATNALELGVDVGGLDATLHLGFQGTVASLWQQSGRAGRREKPSLSIYIAFGSPLDQYFMRHPKKLFSRAIEHAQVDASNPQVLDGHIACASVEHPVNMEYDEEFFGSCLQASITRLVSKGQLGRDPKSCTRAKNWHYIGQERFIAQAVSIRAIEPEKYIIVNSATNEVIEEVEESKAFFEVYEGAVYIHQGKTYLVKTLDLGAKVAVCQAADVKYYTKTRDFTDVHVIGGELAYPRKVVDRTCLTTSAQASLCKVTTRWLGFRRIWQGTNQTFDSVDLFLPDYTFESQAAWIRVPHPIRGEIESLGLPFRAGLHAASHALLNIIPLYILCNGSDLGTECANPHDTRYFPERLLVFDRHPGGIGIAAQAQPLFGELILAAKELLSSCDCTADVGCPNCVQYLECSEYNEVLNKPAAIHILQGVIAAEDSYRQGRGEIPSETIS
ncbi:hypothetical protein GOP47_0017886, partial [Adiantum capillus-veneris]